MQTHKTGVNNIEPHKDTFFSFYKKPITNVYPTTNINLEQVYNRIISSDYLENTKKLKEFSDKNQQKDFKNNYFDYVTFSGTFSKRNDMCLINPSGLFIIDIDDIEDKIEAVSERLIADKILNPQLVFISPSGKGLKIVIRIDISIIDKKKKSKKMDNVWQAVNSYFGKNYADLISPNEKNQFIDGSGKDLSRPCFLCHDENAYLNINEEKPLSQSFIKTHIPIEDINQNKTSKSVNKDSSFLRVNPATTLKVLSKRHLMNKENHTPQLLSFIGAAKNIGQTKAQVIKYITEYVHISEVSSKKSHESLVKLVDDIFKRYGSDSDEIRYISPLEIAYKMLYFSFNKSVNQYLSKSLCRVAVEAILFTEGFAKRHIGKGFIPIKIRGCIICEVTVEMVNNHFRTLIDEIKEGYSFIYQELTYQIPVDAIKEIYLRDSHNIFNENWLRHLQIHAEPILKDTETKSYFFFKNSLVVVTKNGVRLEKWEDIKGFCIWEDQLIRHDFNYKKDSSQGHFYKFLVNVTNNDDNRRKSMDTSIGYLLHHNFRESEGQAVLYYDETITDSQTPEGGSGKGLIVNAIKQVRKVAKIDGKHFDGGNRFRWEQITPSSQVVWLDDVKPDFDFSILHSNLTDGWTVERKYKSQFTIEVKDSPKTVICSNSIIKGGGSTNKRRQFIVELGDYYSSQIIKGDEKPIEQEHGGLFFSDSSWDSNQWNLFYSTILDCAWKYHIHGLVYSKGINVELNRFRQSTDDDFASWVEEQEFENKQRYETKKYYEEFIKIYYGDSHQIGQRKFTSYLKEYARYKGWKFDVKQSNGVSYFSFI